MKKAQGISINVIIIAAIALLVLVILAVLLLRSGGGISTGTSCEAISGAGCYSGSCPDGMIRHATARCAGDGQTCCIPLEGDERS
jgi:uncharacterized membrane protein